MPQLGATRAIVSAKSLRCADASHRAIITAVDCPCARASGPAVRVSCTLQSVAEPIVGGASRSHVPREMSARAIALPSDRRLSLLQRLDRRHRWATIDDRRLCLGCGKLITGRDVQVFRSMGGLGPLRLRCPSEDCRAGPLEWVLPGSSGAAEIAPYRNGDAPPVVT